MDQWQHPRNVETVIHHDYSKSWTDRENYKPIALTSCQSKAMEKIVNTQVDFVLGNEKINRRLPMYFYKKEKRYNPLNTPRNLRKGILH